MNKIETIGFMAELDRELRIKLADYPFCELILDEVMDKTFKDIKEISWEDDSFTNKEIAIESIMLSIRTLFRSKTKSFESKYWSEDYKYIGPKKYNRANLGYLDFQTYLNIDNQKSAFFIGGAECVMRNYNSIQDVYPRKKEKVMDYYRIVKALCLVLALILAYLFALNGRYYIINSVVIDKWERNIVSWGEFIKD